MTGIFVRGVSFPQWVNGNGRFARSERAHSISESIAVILKTGLGECVKFCAFIVLNIFLPLLQPIFQWMPCVKTCIPFSKKE
jgi:hypothetical protein